MVVLTVNIEQHCQKNLEFNLNIEQCWLKNLEFNLNIEQCCKKILNSIPVGHHSLVGIYVNAPETCGMPLALILEKDNFFPYGFINIKKGYIFLREERKRWGVEFSHLWFLLYVSDLANNQCLSFKGERKIKNLCY